MNGLLMGKDSMYLRILLVKTYPNNPHVDATTYIF